MNEPIFQQPFTLESLDLQSHRLVLRHPLVTAAGTFDKREILLLRARIRVGEHQAHGFGETAPLAGWTSDSLESAQRIARQIDYPVSMRALADLNQHLPHLSASPALRFGIETSLLDALCRRHELSVSQALAQARGVQALTSVPVQFTLGAESAAASIRVLRRAAASGYTHAKLKVGVEDCSRDLARVFEIMNACPELTLRLDANAAWQPDQALQMLAALPRQRVEMIEQPVPDRSLAELLERYDGEGPLIAADESCAEPERARALIKSGRLGAIVVKPSVVGGLLPASRMFELARRHGVQVIVSNLMESAVGRRAIAHLAAAWPELPGPHGLATGAWFARDLAPAPDRIERARLILDTGPGIGFEPGPENPA